MDLEKHKIAHLPSVRRLPAYLHLLQQLHDDGQAYVSGTRIAAALKLEPIQVRKDLAITGIVGKPRVGFPVSALIAAIEQFLGWNNTSNAFLIGVGNLGSALLGYKGFQQHGLHIIAAFDADPQKTGTRVHGVDVLPLHAVPDYASRLGVRIGILTVPANAAQVVADMLISARFQGIWNFTPTTLSVPPHVVVQNEDLACGLAVLTKKLLQSQRIE